MKSLINNTIISKIRYQTGIDNCFHYHVKQASVFFCVKQIHPYLAAGLTSRTPKVNDNNQYMFVNHANDSVYLDSLIEMGDDLSLIIVFQPN